MDSESTPDFFISYNKADRSWAEWIAWQLEEDGYTAVLQAWDFRPGSSFVQQMQTAVQAERTIAVLSENYLTSKFTQPEWQAAFAQDPTGKKGLLLPVRVETCDLKGLLPQIIHIDLVGLDDTAARRALQDGIKRGRAKPDKVPSFPGVTKASPAKPRSVSREVRFPGALPPVWNVPHHRNVNFTGRADVLETLQQSLQSGKSVAVTQAIHGLGGVGKTQIALEYAYRYQDFYEIAWWVGAESPVTLATSYAALATELSLAEKDQSDQQLIIRAVRRWLEHNGKWLLIFDNATQPSELQDYLPRSASGGILITSRHREWDVQSVPITTWLRVESVKYIGERTGEQSTDDADELAEKLGDLPLALSQACGYIRSTGMSLKTYVELFRTRYEELWQDEPPPTAYEGTVATTWQLALNKLPQASADLLRLCSFLAPDNISWGLLEKTPDEMPGELAGVLADPIERNRCVRSLANYSLVEANPESISVHRLLQAVVRGQLDESEREAWAEAAVDLVDAAFEYAQDDPNSWASSIEMLPHVRACVEWAGGLRPDTSGQLMSKAGLCLMHRGQFGQAKAALQKAIAIAEKAYEADHPNLAVNYSNLALVEKDLGNLNEARSLLQKAYDIEVHRLGPEHTTSKWIAECLATVQ